MTATPRRLISYFTDRELAQQALRAYADYSRGKKDWPLSEKMRLYVLAHRAFESGESETARMTAFEEIFAELKQYWGLARGGSVWPAHHVYRVLTTECQQCSRSSGLTLADNLYPLSSLLAIVDHYRAMGGIKHLNQDYPTMAVLKPSHFFSPRLFVIYDTAVVYRGIIKGVFSSDWLSFDRTSPLRKWSETDPQWLTLTQGSPNLPYGVWDALHYLLWASSCILRRHETLMDDFVEFFVATAGQVSDAAEVYADLKSYYGTAWEMIAIGAMHLQS